MVPWIAFLSVAPALVYGHGQIHHVVANGVTNDGPNIYYTADAVNKKTATRVMYKASGPAFVLPSGFNDNLQMSCEGSARSGAPQSLSVKAGGSVDIYWVGATSELLGKPGTGGLTAYNPWVHAMGPIQDYITFCNGDCSDFDSTNAGWTKLAGAGLDTSTMISDDLRATMKGKPEPYYGDGLWAMAKMVQAGSKWSIKIPESLANGNYLLRHELSAVHSPKTNDPTSGPQLYISCVQIHVTGGGNVNLPIGTQAKDLYDPNGDFANYNVYTDPKNFVLPGPPVWDPSQQSSPTESTNTTAHSTSTRTSTYRSTSTKTTTSTHTSTQTITKTVHSTSTKTVKPTTTSKTLATSTHTTSLHPPSSTRRCRQRARVEKRELRAHHRRKAVDF